MAKVYIGIDPGVNNGFAVWHAGQQKFLQVKTLDFWALPDAIQSVRLACAANGDELLVRLEWPNANRPVFDRGVNGRRNLKIAQNVGQNKADAARIAQHLERQGIAYQKVTPGKNSLTKKDAAFFRQQTGYIGRTSEHARDAAFLVWKLK